MNTNYNPPSEADISRAELLLLRSRRRADIAGAHYSALMDNPVPSVGGVVAATDISVSDDALAAIDSQLIRGAITAVASASATMQALARLTAETAAVDPVLMAVRQALHGTALDRLARRHLAQGGASEMLAGSADAGASTAPRLLPPPGG